MLSASVAFSENYIQFIGYELLPTDKCSIIIRGTGLKDKKGLEIYQGDILTDKDKNTTIVVWIDEWAMFGCMFHREWKLYRMRGIKEIDENMFWTFPIENMQYKVIGNIYENSDLFSKRFGKS